MATAGRETKHADAATPSRDLLRRARAGDDGALSVLFHRNRDALLRWARGRLPRWARTAGDTTDIVHDVLLHTLRRIDVFEDRGKGALQAYLRQAVDNRIADELRKVARRPMDDLSEVIDMRSKEPSPFDAAASSERESRYKRILSTLSQEEQRLIVGRMELEYNYEQLAVITNRSTAEAARLAVRRAVIKLAKRLAGG
jgi:RNA polymerase sigma-70 factor (ECF subfamily)